LRHAPAVLAAAAELATELAAALLPASP